MIDVSNLHQGVFLDGEKPNRRWIAVILSEDDIVTVLKEVNAGRKDVGEPEIEIDDLDLDHLARKYSDAMTEEWFDTMKALLEFDPESFVKTS